MEAKVVELNCPGCGSPVDTGQQTCKYCKQPVVISTFSSVYEMQMPEINKYAGTYKRALESNPDNKELNTSIAMCYLKLKLYEKAIESFEKAIEDNFDNSEIYFYAAICILKGQKAFLLMRPAIDKIEEYINAAILIEPKGIYYYLWAYIKYDYFHRKYFNTSPDYQEMYTTAQNAGLSAYDVDQLFAILNVERPTCL